MPQASMYGGVWDDALAPGFAQGPGSAAPGDVILATATGPDTTMDVHLQGFNENTEDRIYCAIQLPHTLLIPATGNVTLSPHVHWTFIGEPTDGETVIWKMAYTYAKAGLTAALAGQFADPPVVVAFQTYTALNGVVELRKHLISETAADVSIPVADCGPSMLICFTLKLDTSSTIANGKVALLYVDWHFQKGPFGTISEYA